LWNYECTTYTSGDPTYTSPHIVGMYGEKGNTGDKGDKGDKGDTGANGSNGAPGYSTASINLYQRKDGSAPSAPTGVTYTFSTGTVANIPTGWY